jgi:Pseudouridylate synthases, 23S RNA-specific
MRAPVYNLKAYALLFHRQICYTYSIVMSLHTLRIVQTNNSSTRLDEFLSENIAAEISRQNLSLPEISKSKIRRLIIAGAVSVNGRQNRLPAYVLPPKATVLIRFDTEKFSFEKRPDDIAFELTADRILYEDDVIIVVNKPASIPTEATMVASRDHLHAAIKRYIQNRDATRNEPYIGVHHRLDRETSGVILFTKTRTVNAAVHDLFLNHGVKKEYEALAGRQTKANRHPGDTFSVENQLARITLKSSAGKWGSVPSGGDYAKTDFCILEEFNAGYRVQAMPLTGRTHQIRVHLAGLGLPLFGDTLYGGSNSIIGCSAYSVPRVMLHAKKLTIPHPITQSELCIDAPQPDDFLDCLDRLRRTLSTSK